MRMAANNLWSGKLAFEVFEFFFRWINRSPSSGKLQNVFVVILNGICLPALNIKANTLRENYIYNYKT